MFYKIRSKSPNLIQKRELVLIRGLEGLPSALPTMWSAIHICVEFVVGSHPCSESLRFSPFLKNVIHFIYYNLVEARQCIHLGLVPTSDIMTTTVVHFYLNHKRRFMSLMYELGRFETIITRTPMIDIIIRK